MQYVVIESTGISEPMQVAETFTAEFSSAMLEADMADEEGRKVLNQMYAFVLLPSVTSPKGKSNISLSATVSNLAVSIRSPNSTPLSRSLMPSTCSRTSTQRNSSPTDTAKRSSRRTSARYLT